MIDRVLNSDPHFGKIGKPRSDQTELPCRIISGDCRWSACISPAYFKDSAGALWDLFELTVYDELRVTAVFNDSDVQLRRYMPGSWEQIFVIIDPKDRTPLLPNQ
jgi:hypothetical protein